MTIENTLAARAERYRALVRDEMRAVVGDSPDGLYAWMRYHLGWEDLEGRPEQASGGKLMRPVAVLLAAEACGARAEQAVAGAAAIELVHNFSLLHDDVEDRSDFRRGRANLWTFAGVAHAINTGDGMFTVDELIETVPGSLMNGIVPVVPPVRMSDAVKSGDMKKKAG